MIIYCDIDGVLMTQDPNNEIDYENAEPIKENIEKINKMYEAGDNITLWTSRGSLTGIDHRVLTLKQLKKFGVKYHTLRMDKPYYDEFIDDRARGEL